MIFEINEKVVDKIGDIAYKSSILNTNYRMGIKKLDSTKFESGSAK
jgi:hypothetical protein